MKKFTKSIAIAAIAIASTGVAEAKIALGGDVLPSGGEFVLAITNLTDETSYVLDTGLFTRSANLTTALPITGTTASDAALASFLSSYNAGDNIIWGFGTSYKKFDELADVPFVGYYGTKETPDALPNNAQGWDQAGNGWDNIAGQNQPDVSNNAINGSVFKAKGEPGNLAPFGKNSLGNTAYNIFGDLDKTLAFVFDGINFNEATSEVTANYKVLGTANLTLSQNGFAFEYKPAGSPAPIPLPAAVWMFGAGLMGVLRINRRKAVAA